MNKALVIGGNIGYSDYPLRGISGFDLWGNSYLANGFSEVKYIDFDTLIEKKDEIINFSPDLIHLQIADDKPYLKLYELFPDAKFCVELEGNDSQLYKLFFIGYSDYWEIIRKSDLVMTPSKTLCDKLSIFDFVGTVIPAPYPMNIDTFNKYYDPSLKEELVFHGVIMGGASTRETFFSIRLAQKSNYNSIVAAGISPDSKIASMDDLNNKFELYFNQDCDSKVELVSVEDHAMFVKNILSRCSITAFVNISQTSGRIAFESAAAGIAHIGTPNSYTGIFYPNTMIERICNVNDYLDIYKKLKDRHFYKYVTEYAKSKIDILSFYNTGKTILEYF